MEGRIDQLNEGFYFPDIKTLLCPDTARRLLPSISLSMTKENSNNTIVACLLTREGKPIGQQSVVVTRGRTRLSSRQADFILEV